MDGYPGEILLSTGIAFHIGGCDKTGHPLIIFPTEYQTALSSISDGELLTLLNYFKVMVPAQQQSNGFSYLINLQKSSQQVISKLVAAFNTLQSAVSSSCVHCLYIIKPKTSKLVTHLEKLTGLKPSKKNPVNSLYQVHILKDFASLHRSVDKISLTDEFGGHQHFNLSAWVQFRMRLDSLSVDISRCQCLLSESRDQMHILCELEISEETQTLLDSINAKYTAVMGNLNLEHVIDECSSVLEELNPNKAQVKYAQGDMLRDVVKHVRTSQRELSEAREQLQLQWRQAQARVVQASQLRGHQKNANKICKWIDRNGSPLLAELSKPINSLEDVPTLKQRLTELSKSFEELEKEADYIHTDVEYMALQDLSEFPDSVKSIGRMKTELEEFNGSLSGLEDKLNTAGAIFSNVDKCYSWYYQFMMSLTPTDDEAKFVHLCQRCLENGKQTSPPHEWMEYIETRLTTIDNKLYRANSSALIQRIRKIFSLRSDTGHELSLSEFKQWRDSLEDGFVSISKVQQLPVVQSSQLDTPSSKVSKRSSRRLLAETPKFRSKSIPIPDSSTDDVEGPEAYQLRIKRATKNRKTPTRNGNRGRCTAEEGGPEVYIDLADNVSVAQLPDSLSHIDLTKFLENEPEDNVLASSSPICLDTETAPTFGSTTTTPTVTKLSSAKQKRRRRRRQQEDLDDTDDSCPLLDDYINTSRGSGISSGPDQSLVAVDHKVSNCDMLPSLAEYQVPQNYQLPYNPVVQKERLERIYRSTSPTPQQKLDMMSALIEEGDESCFHVKLEDGRKMSKERITPLSESKENRPIGRLTPANLSRELSADVTYPEHIYHWLNKQNTENFQSRENLTDMKEDDCDSVKDCIRRAESILDEELPSFPTIGGSGVRAHRLDRGYGDYSNTGAFARAPHRALDINSKSGDSGITDLTNRDTHTRLSNGQQRYVSRESGLDSDVTGYTAADHSDNTGTRPKDVPPLWAKKSTNHVSPQHRKANHGPTHRTRTSHSQVMQ